MLLALLSCVPAHGRNFLLFLCMSVLLSGPLSNTLENTERAAASLSCAAELAANQTQELMQRAATPLFCKSRPRPSTGETLLNEVVLVQSTTVVQP